ncbi:FixH family protein [Paenibacillus sp. 598K]|uniref:FixH family protein n=1 Tax=Paenibacillus sp. 598K TaxID=1117987 RepID=UPI0021AB01BA|nr:FixH family protein [Paenibacillus sp. 598K]
MSRARNRIRNGIAASQRHLPRRKAIVALLLGALLLAGCTAQTGDVDEHGLRPHLRVDLQLPEQLAVGETAAFMLDVTRGDEPVVADAVRFVLWPETAPEQRTELAAAPDAPGRYSVAYRLPAEGVYVIRAYVEADKLEAMPAKRFAIGADAVLELAALEAAQAGAAPATGGGGHHH